MNPLIDPLGKFTAPDWKPCRLEMELDTVDENGHEIVPYTRVTYRRVTAKLPPKETEKGSNPTSHKTL